MPIIFNNTNKDQVSQPVQAVQRAAVSNSVEIYPVTKSPDHHILVVDGKAKMISKRSQYLLDMMTTEEE